MSRIWTETFPSGLCFFGVAACVQLNVKNWKNLNMHMLPRLDFGHVQATKHRSSQCLSHPTIHGPSQAKKHKSTS